LRFQAKIGKLKSDLSILNLPHFMETSYFLAKLFGAVLFAVGLGLVFNQKYYQKLFKDVIKNGELLFISGWIALPAGIALVTSHNVWDGPWWVTLLTVLGWAILFKGVMLFVAPEWMQEVGKSWVKNKTLLPWIGLFYLAVGVILGYYGFFY